MRLLRLFVFSVIPFCVLGCSDPDGSGVTEGLPDAEGVADAGPATVVADGLGARDATETSNCRQLPLSQAESAPCCPEHGIDACGADLFCAAFDGRLQPTCYRKYSRDDGTQCAADAHCASRDCNAALGRCRCSPGAPCSVELGCGNKLNGKFNACVNDRCVETTRQEGAPCATARDCASEICVDNVCGSGAVGSRCKSAADCTVPFCAVGLCSDGAPARPCSADSECEAHTCVGGACQSREGGAECRDNDDCDSGACAGCIPVNKLSGSDCVLGRQPYAGHSGTCLHGRDYLGGVCSDLSPCSGGTCVYNPALGVSQCSNGNQWSLCTSDDHCAPDFKKTKRTCLINPEYPESVGVCSSGRHGEPCKTEGDCTGTSGGCDKVLRYHYKFGYCK